MLQGVKRSLRSSGELCMLFSDTYVEYLVKPSLYIPSKEFEKLQQRFKKPIQLESCCVMLKCKHTLSFVAVFELLEILMCVYCT